MRRSFILIFGLLCVSSVVWAKSNTQEPFALVELFTSEGCSSCPPADMLLSKLIASSVQNNIKIYPISLHVDYWNRLGWRDPFSQKQFTTRQNQYAKSMDLSQVATPQFVINGVQSVFGAEGRKLQDVVNKSLSEDVTGILSVAVVSVNDANLKVSYAYDEDLTDKLLQVVLIEHEVAMDVASGENAGRRLKHSNVARQWQTVVLSKSRGQVGLNFAHVKPWEDFSVIAFVQDALSMEIQAATLVDIK